MSLQGSPTLVLDVGNRRAEKRVAAVCALLAAAAAFISLNTVPANVPMVASIPIALAAAAVALAGFRNAGWIDRRRRIQRIVWQADGRWCLIGAGPGPGPGPGPGQGQAEGILHGSSRVGARYAWLRWDVQSPQFGPGAVRRVLLVAGDVSEPDLRRLVMRLRIDGALRPPERSAPPEVTANP
jgi:hypothetical protein